MPLVRAKPLLKLGVLLGLLAAAYFFVRHTEFGQSITIERLRDFVASAHPLAARLLYVLVYIAGTVLLLPGVLLSFVGALLFGVWEGTLWTWLGATLGATLAFLVAKSLGREFVDQLLAGRLKALGDRLRAHGFTGLLVLRLVPLFPFNGLNFGCGLTTIRTRDYVLATALGILPGTFIYQYLFATLGEKVLDEGFTWRDLAQWDVMLALAGFVAFALGGSWFVRRLRLSGDQRGADGFR
jgi:uncharacterized membrane protein YdjX (TVP38/TMEM64 family)